MKVFELNEKYSISYGLVEKVFNNLKPRKDRYSVVDLIYNNQEIKNKILKEYINILNLKENQKYENSNIKPLDSKTNFYWWN